MKNSITNIVVMLFLYLCITGEERQAPAIVDVRARWAVEKVNFELK